jgi:hypothetical protein
MGDRKPEQALWDDLRGAMGTLWFAKRIEDRIGSGAPDVAFALKKKRFGWMELKVLPKLPQENRIFDIAHFNADQRAFGLQSLKYAGASGWWLLTRAGGVDHLHRATIIDDLGAIRYSVFRNKAAWVGRINVSTASDVTKILSA